MAYRHTKKARKFHSTLKAQCRESDLSCLPCEDEITIHITRKLTGEDVTFVLKPGDRSDNYRNYCDGRLIGIMGITKVLEGIRKALPRKMSELWLAT